MSACKITRRAPARSAKPFQPVIPASSLVYEGGNYYRQQEFVSWTCSFNGSFSKKDMHLYPLTPEGIKGQARTCELSLDSVFSIPTSGGLPCGTGKDATIAGKKERRYFWSEHLLFLRPSICIEDSSEDKIMVTFPLCTCPACKKKPGISIKSLKPIRMEMYISASAQTTDPPQFATVPLILYPGFLINTDGEPPNSKISKTGLISSHDLIYFTELNANTPVGLLTLDQFVFNKMAAKFLQIFDTEIAEWSTHTTDPSAETTKLKLKRRADLESTRIPQSCQGSSATTITHVSASDISQIGEADPVSRAENQGQVNHPQEPAKVDERFLDNIKLLIGAHPGVVAVKRPTICLKTMLEEEIGTDWEIISTDGKVVKCHMAVLATQVPFFRSLEKSFGTGGNLNLTGFAMPSDTEMDEKSVKAFLRFVYYQDTELMKASFQVSFTMLRAGHSYQLSSLMEAAAEVIMKMGNRLNHLDWFSVEGMWKLFAFVRSWDDGYTLKTDLINVAIDVLKILLIKKNKSHGVLRITDGNEVLADLIYGFLTR